MCLKIDHQKRIDTNEDLRKKKIPQKQTNKQAKPLQGTGEMVFQAVRSLGTLIIEKETEKMSVLHKTRARFIQEPCFSFCIWASYKLLKMHHLTLCV